MAKKKLTCCEVMNTMDYFCDPDDLVVPSIKDLNKCGMYLSEEGYKSLKTSRGYQVDIRAMLARINEDILGVFDKDDMGNMIYAVNLYENAPDIPELVQANIIHHIKVSSCLIINDRCIPITLREQTSMMGDEPENIECRKNMFYRMLCQNQITPEDLVYYQFEMGQDLINEIVELHKTRKERYMIKFNYLQKCIKNWREKREKEKIEWLETNKEEIIALGFDIEKLKNQTER